jgi:hypothetical protein
MMVYMPIRWFLTVVIFSVLTGCMSESDTVVRRKLEVILKDDLATVVSEVKPEIQADKPVYSVIQYTSYTKSIYSAKAVVDFYLFKSVKVKMVRKYRYHSQAKQWERYLNEYRFVHDTLSP